MIHRWRMRGILLAYSEGALSPRRHQALTRHLQRCTTCRKTLQSWTEADRLLQDVYTPTPRLSVETAEALFQRALSEAGLKAYRPASRRNLALGGAALACVVALSAVWLHPHPTISVSKDDALGHTTIPTPGQLPTHDGTTAFALVPTPTHDYALGAMSGPSSRSPVLGAGGAGPRSGGKPEGQIRGEARTALAAAHDTRHPTPDTLTLSSKSKRPLRRHPASTLERAPAQMALARFVDPAKQTVKPVESTVGCLFVAVTHEPKLALMVTQEAVDTPGYARAACFRTDLDGSDTWATCTVSSSLALTANIEFTQTRSFSEAPSSLLKVAVRFLSKEPEEKLGEKP